MQDFSLLQKEINLSIFINRIQDTPLSTKYEYYDLDYTRPESLNLEEEREDDINRYYQNDKDMQDIQTHKEIIEDTKTESEKKLKLNNLNMLQNVESTDNSNENSFLNKKTERNNILSTQYDKSSHKSDEAPLLKSKTDLSDTEKIYRNDYYIKKFKVECFSKYATKQIKNKIKESQFPSGSKISKIYKPNNKCFTSETNRTKNKEFLNMKLSEAFSLYDEEKGKNQIKNREIFTRIYKCTKARNKQAHEELKIYINKTVEDIIKEYYMSKEFIKFKSDKEIIEKDEGFYREKKFSLLKDYGFIKLIKNQY